MVYKFTAVLFPMQRRQTKSICLVNQEHIIFRDKEECIRKQKLNGRSKKSRQWGGDGKTAPGV